MPSVTPRSWLLQRVSPKTKKRRKNPARILSVRRCKQFCVLCGFSLRPLRFKFFSLRLLENDNVCAANRFSTPACDIRPCAWNSKCPIIVEAKTVRRDRIRPILGFCSYGWACKFFDIKILPVSA
jgi:hypothetical protein